MFADDLSSATTEIGAKVAGHIPEFVSLVTSSAMWAISLLVILPKSGIRLFPEGTRLTKWYGFGILVGLAAFTGWFARDDLSFADAALVAAAVYLCLGAAFPAVYVLRKWKEKDESSELEASANVWALLAVVLALQFGGIGTVLYAKDNKDREIAAKKIEAGLQESRRLLTEQSQLIEALQTALQAEKEARARLDTTQTTQLGGLAADERQFRERVSGQLKAMDDLAADEQQFHESVSAQLKTMDDTLQHLKPSGVPPRNQRKTVRPKAQNGPPPRAG